MKVLLWHGYLLSGSGSNIYTANIARQWRQAGHEVLVMCQDRRAGEYGFVDATGRFSADNSTFEVQPTGSMAAPGYCTVITPDIGELLPVYVFDEYEGFRAKLFVELSDEELHRYTAANVAAMTAALETFRPECVITGHEVMGPFIARQACRSTGHEYVAKLHGSALEYAVKPQQRFQDYAREGLSAAKYVAGGSRYMITEASSVVGGWEHKAVVVNPGCDTDLFKPRSGRDDEQAPIVGYVGKLIAFKGVHNLLAALGLTSTPELRAVIVGYGGFEQRLKALSEGLRRGDRDGIEREIAEAGDPALDHLRRFVGSKRASPAYFERCAEVEVSFPGRLDHGPLAEVLPGFDLLVVPSILSEAFGMVAAEAAACGVIPIVPRHSGIGEVGAALEEAIDRPGFLSYDPSDPIEGIAHAIDRILARPSAERAQIAEAVTRLARERWSWAHVAEALLDLAHKG